MSTTINLTNVIAAKGYGGVDLVGIYGQGGVKIWEAESEPVGPVPEWYGRSENYDFSQDYMSILPLEDGEIRFWLPEGNSMLYSNTGNENSWTDLTGSGFTPVSVETDYNVWSIPVRKYKPVYLKKGSTFVYGQYNRIQSQVDYYVRGNMDKSFASSSGTKYQFFFQNDYNLLGAKYLKLFTGESGYGYIDGVCDAMFMGCTGLKTIPQLNKTTLRQACYQNMFRGCTSLVDASIVLPAASAAASAYRQMFYGCSNLTNPPIINATVAYMQTFDGMFMDCTSLITAPAILVTERQTYLCQNMFNGCTKLNYIKCLIRSTVYGETLKNWVTNVAATGIFVRNISATWTERGNSGVPNNWTIIYYDLSDDKYYIDQQKSQECDDHGNPLANYSQQPFTIVAKESGTITMLGGTYEHYDSVEDTTGMAWYEFEQSTDEGQTWTAVPYEPDDGQSYITLTVSADDRIMLRCNAAALADDTDNSGFEYTSVLMISDSTSIEYEVEGNIMSLIYGSNFIGKTELAYTSQISGQTVNFNVSMMFAENVGLLSAENLILPSMELYDNIYQLMFAGCSSLTSAPALPATTLASSCYSFMFERCSSLTAAPALPATTLAQDCYTFMFNGCTSLNHITMLATDISANDCLNDWVDDVAATGTFVKAASMTSLPPGADGIPSGWTVQDAT